MLYVPEGCAHGYLTLEDETEVMYPVTCAYRPEAERGVRWNDPAFGIRWPEVGPLTLSPKDQAWPDFVK
jgi:dTDP-4-dehydrorhamnose 3,5-epimerase